MRSVKDVLQGYFLDMCVYVRERGRERDDLTLIPSWLAYKME